MKIRHEADKRSTLSTCVKSFWFQEDFTEDEPTQADYSTSLHSDLKMTKLYILLEKKMHS